MHWKAKNLVCHLVSKRQIVFVCGRQSSIGWEIADERIEITATEYALLFHLEIEFITRLTILLRIDEDWKITVVVSYSWHIVPEMYATDRT